MYYSYSDSSEEIIEINIKEANTIIELNKKGKLPKKLEDYSSLEPQQKTKFQDATGKDKINRFDKKIKNRKK